MRYMQEITNTINAGSFRMLLVRLFGTQTQVIDNHYLLTLATLGNKRYVIEIEVIGYENH